MVKASLEKERRELEVTTKKNSLNILYCTTLRRLCRRSNMVSLKQILRLISHTPRVSYLARCPSLRTVIVTLFNGIIQFNPGFLETINVD